MREGGKRNNGGWIWGYTQSSWNGGERMDDPGMGEVGLRTQHMERENRIHSKLLTCRENGGQCCAGHEGDGN